MSYGTHVNRRSVRLDETAPGWLRQCITGVICVLRAWLADVQLSPRIRTINLPTPRRVYVAISSIVTGFAFLSRLTQNAPPSSGLCSGQGTARSRCPASAGHSHGEACAQPARRAQHPGPFHAGPVPLFAAPGPADVAGGVSRCYGRAPSALGGRAAYWPRTRPSRRPAVPPDPADDEVAETALQLDAMACRPAGVRGR